MRSVVCCSCFVLSSRPLWRGPGPELTSHSRPSRPRGWWAAPGRCGGCAGSGRCGGTRSTAASGGPACCTRGRRSPTGTAPPAGATAAARRPPPGNSQSHTSALAVTLFKIAAWLLGYLAALGFWVRKSKRKQVKTHSACLGRNPISRRT